MMKISHICKSFRYFSNPQLLRSPVLQSSPPFCLFTPPKTLICSKSLLSVTSVESNQLYKNPASGYQFRLILSSGSALISSPKPSLCLSQGYSYLCADRDLYHSRRVVLNPAKNRIQWNTTSGSQFSIMFSSGSSSFFQSQKVSHFCACSNIFWNTCVRLNVNSLKPYTQTSIRLLSISSFDNCSGSFEFGNKGIDELVPNMSPKRISEIIEVIRSDEIDMEVKLNLMNLRLSVASVTEIFRVLNLERLSAMRFFGWISHSRSGLSRNYDICSLIIDNCGRLGDYETMRCLLKDFNSKRVCLTSKAFGFVPVFTLSKASIMDFVRKLIEVLDDVGGVCRRSGLFGLIEMFSVSGSFEMAKFVMEITERKTSYYNILVREMCRKCNFKEARDLLDEMRLFGCRPNAKTYNYLLSSLCKNNRDDEACNVLEEMQEAGCPPDALTFEIFIYYTYRLGKLDFAIKFLDQMVSRGLEPRLTTHAAFIKGYFHSRRYEEAYEYVVDSGVTYKWPSNMIYSLLASLHQRNGNLISAQKILIEMIEKGLKPNFSVYKRVLEHLDKSGREDLAGDLRSRFSSLSFQSSTETG